jgi:drug/metabolite transporter (DMT)-like permease
VNNHRLKAYVYLTLVAVIWGFAGPIIKFTLGEIPPILFLTYRFFLASIIAIPVILINHKNIFNAKVLPKALLYGFVTSTIGLGFLFAGIEKTTALHASFITLINPLLITIAGIIVFKDRVTKREKLGTAVAFAGALLLVIQPLINNGKNTTSFEGNLLVLVYLIANTVTVVMEKTLNRSNVKPFVLTNFSFVIGFLSLLPVSLILYKGQIIETIFTLDLYHQLGVFYMAFVSGTIAYTLWVKGQKTIEISEAGLFIYLNPIFATPLAVLWLKEDFSSTFILGAAIVTAGVIISEIKRSRH